MDMKTRPIHILSIRDPPQNENHTLTKSKGIKETLLANENKQKAGVAILISHNIDFNTKAKIRDKEEHYMIIRDTLNKGM